MVLGKGNPRRFVVLGGAGTIGRVIVRDLFESHTRNQILIADFNGRAAQEAAQSYRSRRISWSAADAGDPVKLAGLLRNYAVVINCTRHDLNLKVMEAALRARVNYLDLGGLFTWTRRQLRLNRRFVDAGITAILGMGCAPGLTNVMAAEAASNLERIDSIRIRVGSRAFNSRPGDFSFPYSARTVIEELTLKPWKWSRGRFVESAARSGWERVEFGGPVGDVWVVATRHSEIATLPISLRAKGIRYVDFKVSFDRDFVRELLRRLRSGSTIRDFETLGSSRDRVDDCEITRVILRGRLVGREDPRTITMDAHARSRPEWGASAGDIDTACPASVVAQMLASGQIRRTGVFAPEDIVSPAQLFNALRRRKMKIIAKSECLD
jgi:saccharopine dehydrogenase-like NADP-dependent oxidoreductase